MKNLQVHVHQGEFHLTNGLISYIFAVLPDGHLGHYYYGKALRHRQSFGHFFHSPHRGLTTCVFPGDDVYSREHILQEYPVYGHGDYQEGCLGIKQENGSRVTNFVYKSHGVYDEKPSLSGLPATHKGDHLCLEIILEDDLLGATLKLRYTIFEGLAGIIKSTVVDNKGPKAFVLEKLMSGQVPYSHAQFDMITLPGAWIRERHVERAPLRHGLQEISSARGASSADMNPYIGLVHPDTTEISGQAYGFSLIYSGNYKGQVQVSQHDQTRVMMGINPTTFSWNLRPGESFESPEMVCLYSDRGLEGLSQSFHHLVKNHLLRGPWAKQPAPILINNWEATYFDFTQDKLLDLAEQAAALGIELFVLDDGWFGHRDNDRSSLGDWYDHPRKLPGGLIDLSKKIIDKGLSFGLWFEPEMISEDSDLFRRHPEWRVATPGRKSSHGRFQYVLDMTRPEVQDYLFERIASYLSHGTISYLKWDMNRSISEPYSEALGPDGQGHFFHAYILGVYALLDRVQEVFPEVLLEFCASGGGRFDLGMLYYGVQGWTSDNTDAITRLKIQSGTSMVYPLRSMGAHVSAVPNHQVLRTSPLHTRANVAYFGTFGYELDVTKLSQEDRYQMSGQIAFYKEHRRVFQYGDFYRLTDAFKDNLVAWQVVSEDRKKSFLGLFEVLSQANPVLQTIKLRGLSPEKDYLIKGQVWGGDELMYQGLPLQDYFTGVNSKLVYDTLENPPLHGKVRLGDFSSEIILIEEKGSDSPD